MNLSKQELRQLALLMILSGFILWVYGRFLISPMVQRARTLGTDATQRAQQVKILEATIANEPTLKQDYERLSQEVSGLKTSLPVEDELPSIIESISEMARKSNVKIQTILPQRSLEPFPGAPSGNLSSATAGVKVFKEVPIQVDALAGFHQLGTFLNLVEADPRPMEIASLRISGDPKEPKRHAVKVLITVFLSAGEPTTSAGTSGGERGG